MLTQALNRIDHVAIVVYSENVQKYVDKISKVLGVQFYEPSTNHELSCIAAVSWDSGLEILAPTKPEGPLWERLQKVGEGSVIIVFGVKDLDAAMRRSEEHGVRVEFEVKMNGDEPWLNRFKVFREAGLENIFASTFVLSQIEPLN